MISGYIILIPGFRLEPVFGLDLQRPVLFHVQLYAAMAHVPGIDNMLILKDMDELSIDPDNSNVQFFH